MTIEDLKKWTNMVFDGAIHSSEPWLMGGIEFNKYLIQSGKLPSYTEEHLNEAIKEKRAVVGKFNGVTVHLFIPEWPAYKEIMDKVERVDTGHGIIQIMRHEKIELPKTKRGEQGPEEATDHLID